MKKIACFAMEMMGMCTMCMPIFNTYPGCSPMQSSRSWV